MGNVSPFRSLGVAQVKDLRLRTVIRDIEDEFRKLNAILGGLVETDPVKGMTRVIVGIRPREVPRNPTGSSTYGVPGEIVRWKDGSSSRLYVKDGNAGEDTDWSEVGSGESGGEVVFIDDSKYIGKYTTRESLPEYPTPSFAYSAKWAIVKEVGKPAKDFVCLENSDGTYGWVPRSSGLY